MLAKATVVVAFLLATSATGEEQKPEQPTQAQGRQMNWSRPSILTKPGYANTGADSDSSVPTQGRSSSSYQPYSSQSLDASDFNRDAGHVGGDYSHNSHQTGYDSVGDDKSGSLTSALTAFLPIGLFLAAIVPNIVTISSGRRKRGSPSQEAQAVKDEATFPILDMISSYGVRSLQETGCQSKIVCEIGRMGGFPEANSVQKALWLTANYVPDRWSSIVGADKLFRHIRNQQCSEYMCKSG